MTPGAYAARIPLLSNHRAPAPRRLANADALRPKRDRGRRPWPRRRRERLGAGRAWLATAMRTALPPAPMELAGFIGETDSSRKSLVTPPTMRSASSVRLRPVVRAGTISRDRWATSRTRAFFEGVIGRPGSRTESCELGARRCSRWGISNGAAQRPGENGPTLWGAEGDSVRTSLPPRAGGGLRSS